MGDSSVIEAFKNVDIDNLTPENVVDIYEQVKEAHKSMQGDYTRKTQEVAEFKKEFDSLKQQLEKERQERERLAQQRDELLASNEEWDKLMSTFVQPTAPVEPKSTPPNGEEPNVSAHNNETRKFQMPDGTWVEEKSFPDKTLSLIQSMGAELNALKQDQDSRTNYIVQLIDLAREKGAEWDMSGVVKHAVDKGINSLKDAYNDFYKEDIYNKRVDEEVEKRLKERLEAERASAPVGGSRIPHESVKFPTKLGSYDDAIEATIESLNRRGGN